MTRWLAAGATGSSQTLANHICVTAAELAMLFTMLRRLARKRKIEGLLAYGGQADSANLDAFCHKPLNTPQ